MTHNNGVININSIFLLCFLPSQMCHAVSEDFLIQCPVVSHIWNFFSQLLRNSHALQSLIDLWGIGKKALENLLFFSWDLFASAITWSNLVWRKYKHIFFYLSANYFHHFKNWSYATYVVLYGSDSKKARLEELMAKDKRSFEFLSSRAQCAGPGGPKPWWDLVVVSVPFLRVDVVGCCPGPPLVVLFLLLFRCLLCGLCCFLVCIAIFFNECGLFIF